MKSLVVVTRTWKSRFSFQSTETTCNKKDAAVAVRSQIGNGPGYCYMHGRCPKCCWLGQVNGLLVCLHIKIFLPFKFNSLAFRSSIACTVVVFELAGVNVLRKLGDLFMAMFRGTHF